MEGSQTKTGDIQEEIISKLRSKSLNGESHKVESIVPSLQGQSEEAESIEDRENAAIIKMRSRWANTILFLIFIIVVFDMCLVWALGIDKLSFSDTSIVVAVIADNFLKIMGLGYLITTELFKKIFPRK